MLEFFLQAVKMWDANIGPGCADSPGVSHLPRISPLLWVGNEIAPSVGSFDVVVSTVPPRSCRTGARQPELTTHAIMFADGQGSETAAGVAFAKRCILEGAECVAAAVAAGKSVLVHCAWGQNRSCAICCAFAVLHRSMSANEAIDYVRERNIAERSYAGQQPPGGAMHNRVFREIIRELERERDAEAEETAETAEEAAAREAAAGTRHGT